MKLRVVKKIFSKNFREKLFVVVIIMPNFGRLLQILDKKLRITRKQH